MKEASKGVTSSRLKSVQILRAFAALSVVAFHSTVLWKDKAPMGSVAIWSHGAAGVDLFFVISGFIVLWTGSAFTHGLGGASRFIELRLIRLVPLYWTATALKIVLVSLAPARLAPNWRAGLWNVCASFLFIPSHDSEGVIRPVLAVGWTLSFEMLFYLIFGAALLIRIDSLLIATPILAMLALISIYRATDWPAWTVLANPIVLEFAFGMIVARLFRMGRIRLRPSAAVCVLSIGTIYLLFAPTTFPFQVVGRGLAASLILTGALALEEFTTSSLAGALVLVGEASYALYLVHGFVLPIVGFAAVRLHLNGLLLGAVLITAGLVASIAAAVVVHLNVERPMTNILRKFAHDRRGRASPAAAASPL